MRKPLAAGGPYAILLVFDDGYDNQYDEAYTYMAGKGLHKATAYINSNSMDTAGHITTAEAQTMYAAGWDIANQGASGQSLIPLTQAQVEAELSTCKTYLDTNSMPRASNHVAYPYGLFDAETDAAMAALGMLTGRAAHYPYDQNFPYGDPPDAYRLPCKYVTADISPGELKSWANAAFLQSRVAIILFHQIHDDDGYPVADFREFIDWVAEEGYTLSTISEMYNDLYG